MERETELAASRKVLVIGDDTRSFLATVRSLGRQGLEVHVAPYDMNAPALRSKYIRCIHRLPYYLDGGERWLAAVVKACRDERFDLVIPCEERALLPLYRHREVLEPLCRLAIPDPRALEAFFDKFSTRELAAELGVPIARGRLLTAADNAADLCAEFDLPMVLKFRRSYSWNELYVRKNASVIRSRPELEQWLEENRAETADVFVEEFWPGLGGGISVLCDRGKVILAFEHQRAHEVTGSSFYRRSVSLDPARLAAVSAMTARIGYTGLAMFEFKLNTSSGEWRLLEVNARPWGSLPLPVALGVNFPFGLYQLLVEGTAPRQADYRAGRYGRNFIPDLWQLRSNLEALRGNALGRLAALGAWLWEFRRVPAGTEVQDLWVGDDRAPAIAELRQFARERVATLRPAKGGAYVSGEKGRIIAATRAATRPLNIVFICQGNICRSPYAEYRLRQMLPAGSAVAVDSAGMLPRNARPSPPAAIAAAHRRGVDLAPHRSRHAFAETVDVASHILIFDEKNLRSFGARYPDLRDRVFFLAGLDDTQSGHEIHDPDGKAEAVFDQTYARIDRCLEGLVRQLEPADA